MYWSKQCTWRICQNGTMHQSTWISAFLCIAWRHQSPKAMEQYLDQPYQIWFYSGLLTFIQVVHSLGGKSRTGKGSGCWPVQKQLILPINFNSNRISSFSFCLHLSHPLFENLVVEDNFILVCRVKFICCSMVSTTTITPPVPKRQYTKKIIFFFFEHSHYMD